MIKKILWGLGLLVGALALFHVVHHYLYCRYRTVSGKSHCGVCGHREICRKYHFKKRKS